MKENKCLSMLKGISCIIVVLLHCPLPGILGDGIIYALRFPVPIFFMISGYYSYFKQDYFFKAKKMLIFILQSELIAGAALMICFFLGNKQCNPLIILHNTNWIKVIFFGSVFNGTLWYLYAMFWGWIIFYFISKFKKGFKVINGLIIPLLIIHIIGRIYIGKYFNIEEYIFLFRSSILFAVPFLGIGRFLAEHRNMIGKNNKKINGEIFLFIGIGLIVVEYLLWHTYMDFQVSTFFTSIGLFLISLQYPDWNPVTFLAKIGRDISKYIYILHIPVKMLVSSIGIWIGVDLSLNGALPLIVIGITIIISYVFLILKKIYLGRMD